MKYEARRFDSIYYLKDFLNENKIPQKNIVGIFRKDNGFIELLYIELQESEKIDCKATKCENCQNHNYCDYEPQERSDKE